MLAGGKATGWLPLAQQQLAPAVPRFAGPQQLPIVSTKAPLFAAGHAQIWSGCATMIKVVSGFCTCTTARPTTLALPCRPFVSSGQRYALGGNVTGSYSQPTLLTNTEVEYSVVLAHT